MRRDCKLQASASCLVGSVIIDIFPINKIIRVMHHFFKKFGQIFDRTFYTVIQQEKRAVILNNSKQRVSI